nr:6237_t:CDS:2 [Entrophospora candida]
MYDVLSKEIKLSTGTLSGFYRHQRKPQVPSLDKIEAWTPIERIRMVAVFIQNSQILTELW